MDVGGLALKEKVWRSRKRKALSPEHCGSKEDVIDLPGPNTCTSGLWVLIPSRLEGEVVSELNTLRVGCVYPPCTTEREVRKGAEQTRAGTITMFFSKKSHGLMTHQPLHAL